ncbi:winged helix-turn-helix domain-containing protein [uncultured Shewanella sp.]|uniref:winged helix-turn-helix domain-containing protein n=1 Tax=uncultured Shewanella sp. TaxID=173975 RepID=UPI0026148E58|nr:winged helix-turn-helix domain-containing protein [uncultured Shewanella sp.]
MLNTQLGTLVRESGEEVALPRLSYQLLCVLCDAAPGIVSQETLMQQVWPDLVVGDETLKQRVKLLRKSLKDSVNSPVYIEVVRGRGYRIFPKVVVQKLSEESGSAQYSARQSSDVLGSSYPSAEQGVERHIQQSIKDAVQRADAAQASAASVLAYWKIMLLAMSLGVFLLMVMFSLSSSKQVPLALMTSLKEDTHSQADKVSQGMKEARFSDQLYQKALVYYHRYRDEDNRHAIDLFHSAIEIDADLAPAYAGLADAYSQGVFQFNGPVQWQQKAIEAAYKAIALDPDLAAGYKALGLAYYNQGWLAKAVIANLKALHKQADFNEAMSNLGFIYREMGLLAQAFQWSSKALEIDPQNSVSMVHQALNFMALEQYVESQQWLNKALLLQPDSVFANDAQGQWYMRQGLFYEAKQHYLKQLRSVPKQWQFRLGLAQSYLYLNETKLIKPLVVSLKKNPSIRVQDKAKLFELLTQIKLDSGQAKSLIDTIKRRLERGSDRPEDSFNLAVIYAKKGENKVSYRYLIQAINQGWLSYTLTLQHPSFQVMRQEKGFIQLLSEMKDQQAFASLEKQTL